MASSTTRMFGREPSHQFRFRLDGQPFEYTVTGSTTWGDDVVLAEVDDDLTAGSEWASRGFCISEFASPAGLETLRSHVTDLIVQHLIELGVSAPRRFGLESYHRFVDDLLHERIVRRMQAGFPLESLGPTRALIAGAVSMACGTDVSSEWRGPLDDSAGSVAPWAEPDRFCVRIVRPRKASDHNPLHKDAWLEPLRHSLNVYVPVAGSNLRSSLPVVPGSHLWNEAALQRTTAGAVVADRKFTVPAVTAARRSVEALRPDPAPGQLMVFSPYLLHGGATNDAEDATRVSLELHFWRSSRPAPPAQHALAWIHRLGDG